jgi:7-cyano-7-deazaguanine tRNA-ribosyltransferase
VLETAHGKLHTPALLPVVHPNLTQIPPSSLKDDFGFEGVITNAYILRRSQDLRERAIKEGVHRLIGFDGPVMTDSGTFQQHMYGDVEVSNLETVSFQYDIGSDIATPLDLFTEPDEPKDKARADWDETYRRYQEAFGLPNPNRAILACTVQGGSHLEVRRAAAEAMRALPPCVHPIGGVVPIMEAGRFSLLADTIATAKAALDTSRPVHLFGAGHPVVLPLAAFLGCDLFDSASYAKYAKAGRLLYPDGTRSLDDLTEHPCACPVCSRRPPDELRAMDVPERTVELAKHNLWVLAAEVRRVRQAIGEGSLFELVEERAHTNPRMLEAVRRLSLHGDLLEECEPPSRARAVRYFDALSAVRPLVERTRQRVLDRLAVPAGPAAVLLTARGTPYTRRLPSRLAKARRGARIPLLFETVWGPVPEELDETYPFAQAIVPATLDAESASRVARAVEAWRRRHPDVELIRYADAQLPRLAEVFGPPAPSPEESTAARVAAILDFQFGRGARAALDGGALEVARSRRTGRIRTVSVDGKHAFGLRAHDGFLTLSIHGAGLLQRVLPPPAYRVTMDDDAAPFVAQGRSAFAKFTQGCDPAVRPGDEVLVVDAKDGLLGVGRCAMNAREMRDFSTGVAVHVKEGVGQAERRARSSR